MTRLSVSDRFVVEHTLGAGGMGTVHRAFDSTRNTLVALKVLKRLDPTSLLRFKTEFRALANLSHPNLVQLFDLVQQEDEYLLSMELVEGTDFLRYVRSQGASEIALDPDGNTETVHGPDALHAPPENDNQPRLVGRLDERKLRHALRQLAEGLQALHASGHLHRDLKPGNVLVFHADERLVICDFGLVMESSARRPRPSLTPPLEFGVAHINVSTTTQIAGTPAFMSPEQMVGLDLTPESDWYSVGAMLYQALALRLPFDPHLPWEEAVRVREERPPEHPLQIAPGVPSDLADLAMALLHPDPAKRASYAEVVSALEGHEVVISAEKGSDLLIGRERELSELRQALAVTRQGRAAVAMVSGMSGMGKSAVVQRFLEESEKEGVLVLRGRCYECEELPYKAFDPLMDALSSYLMELHQAEVKALLPVDVSCLAELFPVLGRVPAIAEKGLVSSIADPFERKRRAITACRRVLRRIAAKHPLVLYVDDLQWGDLDSGPLFAELLRGVEAPPLLLLFAFRAEDEASCALIRALREEYLPASRLGQPLHLRVEALAPEHAERLASALLSGTKDSERAVQAVVAESGGSPFFIRELASFVRAHGVNGAGRLKLETVLEARISALPEHGRALLEVVAVAGRPELQAVLHEASGLGPRAFPAGQILKASSLVHGSGALSEARLEANHDRIRETVYELLPESRRKDLHRALAVTLELFAERNGLERDGEALCDHFRHAGEQKRALEYAVLAAHKAELALAFLHAAELYRKAIALADDDPARVSQLEAQLGKALMFAGRGVEAADAFFRAMQHASEGEAQDYRRLAITQLLSSGSLARAFAELKNAEDVLGLSFPRTNARAIGTLVWRRLRTRLDDAALKRAAEAAPSSMSQKLDNLYKVSTALSAVDFLRGGVYTAEHTLRALEHGHPVHLASALSIEAIRSAGPNKKPAQTTWIIERGLEIAKRSGDPYAVAVTVGTAGVSRYLEGRFEQSIRLVRESQRIHREQLNATMAWDLATMCFFEMRGLSQVGRVNEIVARVPDVLRDAEARGDLYSSTLFRVSRNCWAWLGSDEPELAQQHVDTAQRQWVQEPYQLVHYYTLQAAGETALYRGRAQDVWERALSERKQMSLVTKIQFTRVENLYLLGRLGVQLARACKEPRGLAEALSCAKALKRESALWAHPLGRLLEGCVAAQSAPDTAREILEPLPDALEKLDMLLPAAVVRYRLAQLKPGEEGGALAEAARKTIAELGVANPEAFVEMLAPGF